MADVNRGDRPLSPHLSVYDQSYTGTLSILHRITGVGLSLAAIMVVWWFLGLSSGPEAYETADGWITSWLGGLILIGSTFALWYHTGNGIRHLYWDTGRGIELEFARKSAVGVVAFAAIMTVFTLIAAF